MLEFDRHAAAEDYCAKLEELDAQILNDTNVSDENVLVLAGEHALRTIALVRLADPSLGLAFVALLASEFRKLTTEQIQRIYPTYQEEKDA